MTTPGELKKVIESNSSWDLAKHRSASKLLELYDSRETRDYLWNLFTKTGDHYYCEILKGQGSNS